MAPAMDPPCVPDLIARPELAALHVLDLVLDMAITALTAAHADVFWDEDIQFEGRPNYDAIRAAKEIFRGARSLRTALIKYRPDTTPPWLAAQQLNLDFEPSGELPF